MHSPAPIAPAATRDSHSIRDRITQLRTRRDRRAPAPAGGRGINLTGRVILVVGLVAVVLMAFRVSWNALSDVARAIGADPTAAFFYPIVIDGLMALALVATLVLTGPDRKFALRVLAAYTIASLLLNYVHGLVPALHTTSIQWGRLTDRAPVNYALVLLATSLPVGSIYFGSDLVAKVLHHNPESADSTTTASAQSASQHTDESASEQAARSTSGQAEPAPEQPTASPPVKATEAPATRLTTANKPTPTPVGRPPRSAAVAESTGAAPRRATGWVPTAEPTVGRPRKRTDAEVLGEARLLTADWSDDQLTATRLRDELRISQKRAPAVRDQLKAERTGQAEPAAHDGFEAEPLGGLDKAASQQQDSPNPLPDTT